MGFFKKISIKSVTKPLVKYSQATTKLLAPVANVVAPGTGDILTKASNFQASLYGVNGQKLSVDQLADLQTIAKADAYNNIDSGATSFIDKAKTKAMEMITSTGKPVTMTSKNAATAVATGTATPAPSTTAKASSGDGDAVIDWIKTGAAGLFGALGTKLGGQDAVAAGAGEAAGIIVKNTALTWLKSNWWKIAIPVVGIVAAVMYFKRGKRGKSRF